MVETIEVLVRLIDKSSPSGWTSELFTEVTDAVSSSNWVTLYFENGGQLIYNRKRIISFEILKHYSNEV